MIATAAKQIFETDRKVGSPRLVKNDVIRQSRERFGAGISIFLSRNGVLLDVLAWLLRGKEI